jgi:multiple sugar transport system permease protein
MSKRSNTDEPNYYGTVPVWKDIPWSTRRKLIDYGLNTLTVGIVLLILGPIYWMLATAIRPRSEAVSLNPTLFPREFTSDHFMELFFVTEFPLWFFNSVAVMIGVVTLTVTLSTLGGYGLARIDVPFRKTFARGILFGYMFPAILLAIPMFIFWVEWGLVDSYLGLILAETALALPFSLWLMWKFFQTVPYSLEESAQMNGATRFRAIVDIVLPMARPGIVAVGIFAFAISWNEYTMPLILMPSSENYVLTVGIETLIDVETILWGRMMAGIFIAILPSFVFVYAFQKYLLRGFRAGGIG